VRGLAFLLVLALSSDAVADEAWMAWETPPDGHSNGIDVSFRLSSANACSKPKPFVAMNPRVRNRYTEHVAGKIRVYLEDTSGARTENVSFDLQPNETKILDTITICHDTRKKLALGIDLRFPEREAEQRKLAEQKAAADKADAERDAARKQATDKAAAEQAAAEQARRKQADAERARTDQAQRDEQQRRVAASEEAERQRIAAEADAAAHSSNAMAARIDELRRGQFGGQLPIGFASADISGERASGLLVGARLELRLFKWWAVSGETGKPIGQGIEFAVAGGYAMLADVQSDPSPAKTRILNGFARTRLWLGPLGLGAFVDWTRYSYSSGMGAPTEQHSLFALGPEVAFAPAAGRALNIELGGRVGATKAGSEGFSAGATQDVYLAAYAIAEMNNLFGGAMAVRFHDVTRGAVSSSWYATGIVGFRLAF
jgi:hypothetical protein